MSWVNYHSHTKYCDGSESPDLYAQKAIELGMPAYGFSSHAPVAFKTEWCIPDKIFEEYISEIRRLKRQYEKQLELYLGLEIDYIPGFAGRNKHLIKDVELDYFIGSVHFVDWFEDENPWNIDTSAELFDKGLQAIFQGNYKKAATRFFEISRQLIEEENPDILGHLDKIKMFNHENRFFREDEKWYRDQVGALLDLISNKGTIVEINTRGYYRYNQTDLYPSQWIIEEMVKRDIPIMLNSDSHKPEEIIAGFEYAVGKLKMAGVPRLWALINKKWEGFGYDSQGIRII